MPVLSVVNEIVLNRKKINTMIGLNKRKKNHPNHNFFTIFWSISVSD